jgi:hypothetical protein
MMTISLGLLLVLIFLYPTIVARDEVTRLLFDVLMTAILATGVVAISSNRRTAILLGIVSAIALTLRWSEWLVPGGLLPDVREISIMLALLTMSTAVAMNVFGQGEVVVDRIVGAIVLYLLIGTVWAQAYWTIAQLSPQAFAGPGMGRDAAGKWIYFSFATLTTIGSDEIRTVASVARSLAMLEALIGQLYPAVILARLVSRA